MFSGPLVQAVGDWVIALVAFTDGDSVDELTLTLLVAGSFGILDGAVLLVGFGIDGGCSGVSGFLFFGSSADLIFCLDGDD